MSLNRNLWGSCSLLLMTFMSGGFCDAREAQRPSWLEPLAESRRIAYLDTRWAQQDLNHFPLQLRFAAADLPTNASANPVVFLEPGNQPLDCKVEYYEPANGLILSVSLPSLQAKRTDSRLHVYFKPAEAGAKAKTGDNSVDANAGSPGEHESIELFYRPDSDNQLKIVPRDAQVRLDAPLKTAPGLVRPAIRFNGGSLFEIIVPKRLRAPEEGWTLEILARDDSPNAKNHIGSMLSAWPADRGDAKLDDIRLINLALINFVFHMSTSKGWVTKAPVDSRDWHAYTARIDARSGRQELFLDGQPASFSAGPAAFPIDSVFVGSWSKPDVWVWRGLVDQVRITPGLLSDDVLRASGMNAVNDERFVTMGPLEKRESPNVVAMPPRAVYPHGVLQRYTSPDFRWTITPDSPAWSLSVWRDGQPGQPVINATVSDLSFTPEPGLIEPGVTYCWMVKTVGRPEGELASEVVSFSLPPEPVLDTAPLEPPSLVKKPIMNPAGRFLVSREDPVGRRVMAAVNNWALRYPKDNPDLTRMLTEQWRSYTGACAWWGDAYGKFLSGAVLLEHLTDEPRVRSMVDDLFFQGISAQEADGYLGALPKDARLTGSGVLGSNWDLSNIMHQLNAFNYEYKYGGGNPLVLRSAMQLADLLCLTYGEGRSTVWEPSESAAQCNWGVIVPLVELYRITGRPRYLDLAKDIVAEWESDYPTKPEWLTLADQGKRLTEMHGIHALEMIYCFEGMLDLYQVTGDERLKKAALHWWREMRERETMAHGNLAPEEHWHNDPYSSTWAETCVVTAYMRLTIKVLALTGDPDCVDAIEKGLYNAYFGAMHPSGRHWCYPVPVNGKKRWGYGSREDNPDIACCFNYGLTGMGLIPFWSTMVTDDAVPALVLNYYGAGTVETRVGSQRVRIEQITQYPADPKVEITLQPEQLGEFPVWLHIPAWSHATQIHVNGEAVTTPIVAGEYFKLDRTWKTGDKLTIEFDFTPYYVEGERGAKGRAAVYRGPLLLTADMSDNPGLEFDKLPEVDLAKLSSTPLPVDEKVGAPWVKLEVPLKQGGALILRDFASAGMAGGEKPMPQDQDFESYAGWIPASR